ncbi:hypothetical protein A2U01_0026552, partial [Trifolium medium]|nr:hypothetical protein [Trifolium medium]
VAIVEEVNNDEVGPDDLANSPKRKKGSRTIKNRTLGVTQSQIRASGMQLSGEFNPVEFVEGSLQEDSNVSRVYNMSIPKARKLLLECELKAMVVAHVVSKRQAEEVCESQAKVTLVDKHLADIQKKCEMTRENLKIEMGNLEKAKKDEVAMLKKLHANEVERMKKDFDDEKS